MDFKKPNGKFNLDYEETVILLGRLGKLREKLKIIYSIAIRLLRLGSLNKSDKEAVMNIVEESGKKEDW